MIELLGVGVRDIARGWRLRRVTATLQAGSLVSVVSENPDAVDALLDAISGQLIPDEGRVWIDRVPLMRETARRVRRRIADIDAAEPMSATVSVFESASWMSPPRQWLSVLTQPASVRRDAVLRSLIAVGLGDRSCLRVNEVSDVDRALLSCARVLPTAIGGIMIRRIGDSVCSDATARLLQTLRMVARQRRITIVVGDVDALTSGPIADCLLTLSHGRLVDDALTAATRCPEPA
jgi:ABC-type cobalamin/Fe3+-siderophores transport system ATPase subunit